MPSLDIVLMIILLLIDLCAAAVNELETEKYECMVPTALQYCACPAYETVTCIKRP